MTRPLTGARPLSNGTRVDVGRFGKGIIIDDYWRDRDRFKVRLDGGGEYDFGEGQLKPTEDHGDSPTIPIYRTSEAPSDDEAVTSDGIVMRRRVSPPDFLDPDAMRRALK